MANELLVHCVRERTISLSPLAKAILLTVHYRDLFCHALTIEELRNYLRRMNPEDFGRFTP